MQGPAFFVEARLGYFRGAESWGEVLAGQPPAYKYKSKLGNTTRENTKTTMIQDVSLVPGLGRASPCIGAEPMERAEVATK